MPRKRINLCAGGGLGCEIRWTTFGGYCAGLEEMKFSHVMYQMYMHTQYVQTRLHTHRHRYRHTDTETRTRVRRNTHRYPPTHRRECTQTAKIMTSPAGICRHKHFTSTLDTKNERKMEKNPIKIRSYSCQHRRGSRQRAATPPPIVSQWFLSG